jgi:hypothetical protein
MDTLAAALAWRTATLPSLAPSEAAFLTEAQVARYVNAQPGCSAEDAIKRLTATLAWRRERIDPALSCSMCVHRPVALVLRLVRVWDACAPLRGTSYVTRSGGAVPRGKAKWASVAPRPDAGTQCCRAPRCSARITGYIVNSHCRRCGRGGGAAQRALCVCGEGVLSSPGSCAADAKAHCFFPIGFTADRRPIIYSCVPRASDYGVEGTVHHVVHTFERVLTHRDAGDSFVWTVVRPAWVQGWACYNACNRAVIC